MNASAPRRTRAALAVLAILATSTILLACNPIPVPITPTTSTTTTAPPVTHWFCLPQAKTAADFNTALNHRDTRWQGGDGASAVPLPDGRTAWIFGDTLYGNINPDGVGVTGQWGMAHGSMLIQTGSCFDPFYSAGSSAPTSLIPPTSSTDVYWPGSGWVGPDGKTLYVAARRVKITDPNNIWGFTYIGNAVAAFDLPSLTLRRIDQLPAAPVASAPTWGWPFHDGGYVYFQTQYQWGHYLARVPDADGSWVQPANWQYWTGTAWSSDPATIGKVSITPGNLDYLYLAKTATGFVTVTKTTGTAGPDVYAWHASAVTGPYTVIGKVADASAVSPLYTYIAHPVLNVPGADPLVVWSRSGGYVNGGVTVAAPTLPLS